MAWAGRVASVVVGGEVGGLVDDRAAIGRGDLSEDDLLVDILPELRAGRADSTEELTGSVEEATLHDKVTVRDLLDIRHQRSGKLQPVVARQRDRARLPQHRSARISRPPENQQLAFEPGARESTVASTPALAMIVAKVNDRPLSEVASTDLWTPLGAESGATWNLDREGGTEKGFCCLNATARDFAKIGQMVLDNGRVGDTQVVPAEWIERISTPSGLKLGD